MYKYSLLVESDLCGVFVTANQLLWVKFRMFFDHINLLYICTKLAINSVYDMRFSMSETFTRKSRSSRVDQVNKSHPVILPWNSYSQLLRQSQALQQSSIYVPVFSHTIFWVVNSPSRVIMIILSPSALWVCLKVDFRFGTFNT